MTVTIILAIKDIDLNHDRSDQKYDLNHDRYIKIWPYDNSDQKYDLIHDYYDQTYDINDRFSRNRTLTMIEI